MADFAALFSEAQRLHRSGDLAAAERDYLRLVEVAPREAQLWHLLGVVAHQRGKPAEAIAHFGKAIALRPDSAPAYNNLALALKAVGRLDEAQSAYEQALQRNPAYAEAAYNLALLHEARGDAARAEAAYRRALEARADWPEALGNLGNLLRKTGRAEESAVLLERVVALRPEAADAASNLALARIDQGRHAEALAIARRAAELDPSSSLANEAAGTAAHLCGDSEAAAAFLRRAVDASPRDAALWFELGLALSDSADDEGARAALEHALGLAPRWERLRWAEALALPRVVASEAEAHRALERFDRGLERLHAELRLDVPEARQGALEAALATVPFNLHYQPGNHVARQRRFAELVARSVRASLPQLAEPRARRARSESERVRVGFVSAYLRTHVVERFFGRFVTDLDPRRFERWVWFTGETGDERTREMAATVEHFHSGAPSFAELAAAIAAARLDALVYLDMGLDPRQLALASLRLAPVQAACYGHPVTSGLDSLDIFLSGEALEDARSQAQYTESLVRLPGLGMRPRPPARPGDGSWIDALRAAGAPLALCPQNLAKIPPAFDAVLASILAGSGARLVLFDRGAGLTGRFRARFEPALRRRGVDPATALHIEPLHAYADYLAGVAAADLVLDTPGFSGGATSLDALGMATPVLAFQGETARARQTSAMLRVLDLPELIAANADDYASVAIALLGDADRLRALRSRIGERSGRLFEDPAPLEAFAAFLLGS